MHKQQFYTQTVQVKFQKVCRQLKQATEALKKASDQQIQSLIKRRDNLLKKLISLGSPLVKAGSAFAVTAFLSTQATAQTCNTFVNADSANLIKAASIHPEHLRPSFVDIDGDGDLDCYESYPVGYGYLQTLFLRNTGTNKLPNFKEDKKGGLGTLYYNDYSRYVDAMRFVDIDGDGDYDCFVGSYIYYDKSNIKYYKNVGTATVPTFELQTTADNPLGFVHGNFTLHYNLTDIDSDGDFDLIVSNYRQTTFYKNVGTKTKAEFEEYKELAFYFGYNQTATITPYDYNKDGLIDFFANGKYFRNIGTPHKPNFSLDTVTGPKIPAGFDIYTFTDLNKDGFPEIFSSVASEATTAPVATITALPYVPHENDDPYLSLTLYAHPTEGFYSYRWRKNGKLLSGENGPTINIYAVPGTVYTVEITDNCGTGVSLPYVINEDSFKNGNSAIQYAKINTTVQPLLKAYPNPFTSQFTLNLGKDYSPNTVVKISDIQGRIISTVKVNSSTLQFGGNLQKGIYIVQVMQNNSVVLTQKMIKQ